MTLLLAPMEGLLDFTLRDVLTQTGGIDRCVSEFIRVTNSLLPERVFKRILPELDNGSRTPSGVPVRGQLLGCDVNCMAENAARLAEMGSAGVDLNFGCPAKVVNRHGGGAALLDNPQRIAQIVSAVRRAVPVGTVVSAKMRLGVADSAKAVDCAQAMAESGADELVVHARTKAQGYRPPVQWERIADIREAVSISVVANGDIASVEAAWQCRDISGCKDLMLGRGMVSDPGLAAAVASSFARHSDHASFAKNACQNASEQALGWQKMLPLLSRFWALVNAHIDARHRGGRLKQWLYQLQRVHPEAHLLYEQVRTLNDPALIERHVTAACPAIPKIE